MTRWGRWDARRKETNLASDQFPKCSPQPGTPKEIHRVKYRTEGEGRRETRPGREIGDSNGERAIKPVITPLSKKGY